jgi:ribonuclease-3
MADAFEAVVGALFLDGGIETARAFVLAEFAAYVTDLASLPVIDNPKGELQELLQATSAEAPQYQLVSASGPDHDRVFECTVLHGGRELARGTGKSKKEAESAAALTAFRLLVAQQKSGGAAA